MLLSYCTEKKRKKERQMSKLVKLFNLLKILKINLENVITELNYILTRILKIQKVKINVT